MSLGISPGLAPCLGVSNQPTEKETLWGILFDCFVYAFYFFLLCFCLVAFCSVLFYYLCFIIYYLIGLCLVFVCFNLWFLWLLFCFMVEAEGERKRKSMKFHA